MAQIVQQKFTIIVSKLAKNDHEEHQVLNEEQLVAVLQTLPGVVEQLIDDQTTLVEISID